MRLTDFDVALVLSGGAALGAYQAGAYEALHEAGLLPSHVAGTSIGAFNGTLIAGNRPEDRVARLAQFWDAVAEPIGRGGYAFEHWSGASRHAWRAPGRACSGGSTSMPRSCSRLWPLSGRSAVQASMTFGRPRRRCAGSPTSLARGVPVPG